MTPLVESLIEVVAVELAHDNGSLMGIPYAIKRRVALDAATAAIGEAQAHLSPAKAHTS